MKLKLTIQDVAYMNMRKIIVPHYMAVKNQNLGHRSDNNQFINIEFRNTLKYIFFFRKKTTIRIYKKNYGVILKSKRKIFGHC